MPGTARIVIPVALLFLPATHSTIHHYDLHLVNFSIRELVDENIIVEATKFPLKSEHWSKTMRVKEVPWSEFLFRQQSSIMLKVCLLLVKNKWKVLLIIIQRFFTVEGRYSLLFYYHFKLLWFC
jgi:hypothetical protein